MLALGHSDFMRVLLFATTTGYQTRAFGEAAERLGVDLVFATDRCDMIEDPWGDHAMAVRFYDEAASVAKQALREHRPIREVVVERGHVREGRITEAELDAALDVDRMARPHDSDPASS